MDQEDYVCPWGWKSSEESVEEVSPHWEKYTTELNFGLFIVSRPHLLPHPVCVWGGGHPSSFPHSSPPQLYGLK